MCRFLAYADAVMAFGALFFSGYLLKNKINFLLTTARGLKSLQNC